MTSTAKDNSATQEPGISEAEVYAKKHLRWNFTVNTIDAAAYFFALAFFSTQVVLPVFVDKLTASPILVGLVGATYSIGFFLPQMLVAGYAERLARQKPFILLMGFGIRVPILILAIACFFFNGATLALIFFICFGLYSLALGANMPSYMTLISKVFPVQTRGIFTGFSNALGNGLGALGGVLVGILLNTGQFPTNFGLIFSISIFLFFISFIGFALNREPVTESKNATEKHSNRTLDYFKELPGIVRQDKNYRNFVVARGSFVAVSACGGLLAAYAIVRFNLNESAVGGFTVAFMIANSVASFIAGVVGDKYGHKLVLLWSCVCMMLALLFALVAPSEWWLYLSFGLYGAFVGAYLVSYQVIVLEFAPDNRRSTYVGLTNTLMAPVSLLAPIIAGALAQWLGYPVMLGVLVVMTIYAIFLLWLKVKDPRFKV